MNSKMSEKSILTYALNIAEILKALREKGFVMNGLSAKNVKIIQKNHVYISDLRLSIPLINRIIDASIKFKDFGDSKHEHRN